MYLLDSSAIIELLAGTPTGKKIEETVGNDAIGATAFSAFEVLKGVKAAVLPQFLDFFSSVQMFSFDASSALKSLEIEDEQRKRGKPVGIVDLFIAGICKKNDLELVTLDKGFVSIPSIKVKLIE